MPNLLKKWCPRSGHIPTDLIKKLDVASFGHPVTTTLTELGWDGTLVAAIGLQLSPDNRQVQRGQFLLRGNISKEPIEIQANLLWPEAEPDVFLTITPPEGTAFRFDSGTLCSDLIACEDYQHGSDKTAERSCPLSGRARESARLPSAPSATSTSLRTDG
jgi:hypothetical protein